MQSLGLVSLLFRGRYLVIRTSLKFTQGILQSQEEIGDTWLLGQSQIYSGYFMITRRDQRSVVIGTSLKFIQRQVVIRTSLKFIQSILGLQEEIEDTFCLVAAFQVRRPAEMLPTMSGTFIN